MGAGNLPLAAFNTDNHTNQLVPLYARGAGSEMFATLVNGIDPVRGAYIDNTDIHTAMANAVPEPGTVALLAVFGLLGLGALARRRMGQ
jgi:alkaline phosphatase